MRTLPVLIASWAILSAPVPAVGSWSNSRNYSLTGIVFSPLSRDLVYSRLNYLQALGDRFGYGLDIQDIHLELFRVAGDTLALQAKIIFFPTGGGFGGAPYVALGANVWLDLTSILEPSDHGQDYDTRFFGFSAVMGRNWIYDNGFTISYYIGVAYNRAWEGLIAKGVSLYPDVNIAFGYSWGGEPRDGNEDDDQER